MAAELGKEYERKAQDFLKLKGYKIIQANFSTRFGEIDIITRDKDCICFVEVKARGKKYLYHPFAAVDERKARRIVKSAKIYIAKKKLFNENFRFDVVGIVSGEKFYAYQLIKGAFDEENNRGSKRYIFR